MGKHASLVYQVTQVLNTCFFPGESRHEEKQRTREEGRSASEMTFHIYSYQTFRTYQRILIRFVKWVREHYPVRELTALTPEMAAGWLEDAIHRNLSRNTLRTYVTALRRFDKLAVHLLPAPLVTPELEHGIHREFAPRPAYTPAETELIIAEVAKHDALAAQALRIQVDGALRIRELVRLSTAVFTDKHTGATHPGIDPATGTLYVRGKGGLQRQITLLQPDLLSDLPLDTPCPLRRGKAGAWTVRLQQLVRAACLKHGITPRGLHAFRATGAQAFHAACLDAGDDKPEADRKTARRLGHGRTSVLRHYFTRGD